MKCTLFVISPVRTSTEAAVCYFVFCSTLTFGLFFWFQTLQSSMQEADKFKSRVQEIENEAEELRRTLAGKDGMIGVRKRSSVVSWEELLAPSQ